MGASTVAGRTVTLPMRTSAGTRTSAGIACSTGLSQLFFTVNPRRGIKNSFQLLAFSSQLRLPSTGTHPGPSGPKS